MKKWDDLSKKGKRTKIYYIGEYCTYLILMASGLSILIADLIAVIQFDTKSLYFTDFKLLILGLALSFFGLLMMKLSDISYNQNKED